MVLYQLFLWPPNRYVSSGVLQNKKKNLAKNIRLIIPGAAKDGLLTTWVYFALDEAYWKYLISQLGSKKTEWTGTEPNPRSTPPPRLSRRRTNAPPLCTPPRS